VLIQIGEALQDNSLIVTLNSVGWMAAGLEIVHYFSMFVLVGSIAIVDPAVENSSLALSEAARLLTVPGRVCSNGRPVPVANADWGKFVQELRQAGLSAFKAAQTKNQDKMLDAADVVTTACTNCHNRYREKPGGVADRCM
jgi:hypothetical protein